MEHRVLIRGLRYWPSRPLTCSHRYTGVPSGCFWRTSPSTRPWNFLGRSWKTTQSVLTARWHGCECIPYSGDGDVLRHHEVVHGPAAPVGQQLGHVDVIHPTRGVQEQLPVLAPGTVELVVAGAHGVDEVHVACPEPDEGIHRQLGVVLLSLRPGRLHLLQGLSHGLLVHVRRRLYTKSRQVARPFSSM